MRGRLYQQHRPDFVLRDDLENAITADSPPITEKIIRLLDEAKGGMAGNRDKNFTRAKMQRRLAQIEESVVRYLS